jgi:O-antigen ligase
MVVWIFLHANSMTSLLCFILVSSVVVTTSALSFTRKPVVITVLIATALLTVAVPLVFNIGTTVFQVVGRDGTLTGRTGIWEEAMSMVVNPLLGAGFESFWLRVTLDEGRSFHLNEAHNGYLEVYLNLGWVGLGLLLLVILSGYRNVLRVLREQPEAGILLLGYWLVCVTYSMTEAGFRMMNLVWICFLLASAAGPEVFVRVLRPAPSSAKRSHSEFSTRRPNSNYGLTNAKNPCVPRPGSHALRRLKDSTRRNAHRTV